MRVMVTGGAGFVGATTARELRDRGYEVLVYDNLSNGRREAVPAGVKFFQGEVADGELVARVMRDFGAEAVLHFAASIEAGESMKSPERYFRNNSATTLTLLEGMLANSVKRFIFSSTAAIYGEPERIPIEETDRLRPVNAYGESKLLVEQMLAWFQRAHGFRYASLRYFNAAGSNGHSGEEHDPESHLIPLLLETAAGKRSSISIFGTDYPTADGTCIRDYVHVSDLADAHVRALEGLGAHDKLIYNLGNGRGFSVREVIDAARRVSGRKISVKEGPRRPGDPAVLIASAEKIRRELGWAPKISAIDDIIASAWKWEQSSRSGYSRSA